MMNQPEILDFYDLDTDLPPTGADYAIKQKAETLALAGLQRNCHASTPEDLSEKKWDDEALCKQSSTDFFPSESSGVTEAIAVCNQCSIRVECLEYALDQRIEHGVWGGTSERERKRILQERRLV